VAAVGTGSVLVGEAAAGAGKRGMAAGAGTVGGESADRSGQRVSVASAVVRPERHGCVAVAEKDRLYRCLDRVLEHKQDLFVHLQQRWKDLFDAEFDLLLYDLTSTALLQNLWADGRSQAGDAHVHKEELRFRIGGAALGCAQTPGI
jgi:hypothetical protein